MKGVQRADRFHGKGASGAGKDRFSDAYDVATPGEPLESEQYCLMLLCGDPPREVCAKNGAAGFSNRESRCDPLTLGTNGGFRGRIALEHCCHQGA